MTCSYWRQLAQEWGSQIMDTRRSMDSTVSILPAGNPPLSFADVSLGVLIRAVPGGLLFRGTWSGEAVSVKVGCWFMSCGFMV